MESSYAAQPNPRRLRAAAERTGHWSFVPVESILANSQTMQPHDPELIRALLKATTLAKCLAWFNQARDEGIREALKPLLFDPNSGVRRDVADDVLGEELIRLAESHAVLRSYLAGQCLAELDRITAGYLREQLGKG